MSGSDQRIEQAFESLGSKTGSPSQVRIGLFGRGIGASLTPVMHEQEGRRLGLDYRYDLIDFDRLDLRDTDLAAMLAGAAARGFAGLNVTYPFKQTIAPLLDGLSPEATAIGAVNTVVFRDGGSTGYNTDCWGFAESFRSHFGPVALDRVIQIGAGGAGSAVAQALVDLGAGALDIVDAQAERAQALAAHIVHRGGAIARAVPPDQVAEALWGASGVVNATPVGMAKHPGLPIDPALLGADHFVVDIIYFPRETALIQAARSQGCSVLPGGGMAVHQAARAFSLFTGLAPDSAAMGRTFAAHA